MVNFGGFIVQAAAKMAENGKIHFHSSVFRSGKGETGKRVYVIAQFRLGMTKT